MQLSDQDYTNVVAWSATVDPDTGEVTLSAGGGGSNFRTELAIDSFTTSIAIRNVAGSRMLITLLENAGTADGMLVEIFQTNDGTTKGQQVWSNLAFPTFMPVTGSQWIIEVGPTLPTITGISANLILPDWFIVEFTELSKGLPDVTAQIIVT